MHPARLNQFGQGLAGTRISGQLLPTLLHPFELEGRAWRRQLGLDQGQSGIEIISHLCLPQKPFSLA
jgi:hypothetical protein